MLKRISLSGPGWKLCGMIPDEAHAKRVWDNPYAAYPYQWIDAAVPGSVQIDLQRAGVIPDFTVDLNSRACEWTSQRQWVYVRHFPSPPRLADERVALVIGGVDWEAEVYLNGHRLGAAAGMWTPAEWDVTDALADAENTLVVIISPAPDQVGQHGHTRHVRLWKPRFAYDWDWCTRLIPLGIFGDVELVVWRAARLLDVWARPLLSADLRSGTLRLAVEAQAPDAGELTVQATLQLPDRIAQATASLDGPAAELEMEVENPPLWWPKGIGPDHQPLTPLTVRLLDGGQPLDERSLRLGWRRIEYHRNEGAPDDALPYTIVVNGQRMHIRGANWVPIRQLYGAKWLDEYRHWVASARAAGINLLRVWGGGLLERPWFYDACDRAGVLVWQEFLQSSSGITNDPATDDAYVAYARRQAEAMVKARRNHPSLAVWCGGNELTGPGGVPLDERHPVLAALADVVRKLDPDRLFLPTSPSGPVFFPDPKLAGQGKQHDVHGQWRWLGDGEHQKFYTAGDYLLHSEVGVEGAANLVSLRRFVSSDRLCPPDASNPIWVHHGEWWINRDRVEELFGPLENIERFVAASQFLQAEALRFILEEDRRKAPRCSGTIIWQLNEAFPNTSCTNVLDYYGQPKPAFYALARAYGRALVSARLPRLAWRVGETLTAEVWAHPHEGCPGGEVSIEWSIVTVLNEPVASGTLTCNLAGDRPARAGELSVPLEGEALEGVTGGLLLTLRATGAVEAANTYPLGLTDGAVPPLSHFVRWRVAEVTATAAPLGRRQTMGQWAPAWKVTVRNTAPAFACGLVVRALGGYATVTPGYVFLPPGEAFEATIIGRATSARVEGINLQAPVELALPAD